jgi:hypothetical protein
MTIPDQARGQYVPYGPYGVPSDIPRYELPKEPPKRAPEEEGKAEGKVEEGRPVAPPPPRGKETQIIPSISISERYDSNVFFVESGRNVEDYVTTANPQLRVEHLGKYFDGKIDGGATAEQYVKNAGLSYVGFNGGVNLTLDKAIQQVFRNATLTVGDSFNYTPQPPAFLAPGTGAALPETFIRGIQAARANSFTNMAKAEGSYIITPRLAMQGIYTHSYMRFGNAFVSPEFGQFFTTTFQTVNAGPRYQLTRVDTVTVNYQYQQAEFNLFPGFTSNGGTVAWIRQITPNLKGSIQGGATLISGISSPQYLADALIEWTGKQTNAALHYSRVVTPSFFIAGVPLVNDLVNATATYSFTTRANATLGLNYAKSAAAGGVFPLSFISYGATAGLNYTLTRLVSLSATYGYSEFKTDFMGFKSDFDRNVVMFSIKAEWR